MFLYSMGGIVPYHQGTVTGMEKGAQYPRLVAGCNEALDTCECGLPPLAKLTILVLDSEPSEWRDKMMEFMNDLREDGHPFSEMSKDKILRHLKKYREEIYSNNFKH